MSGRPPTQTTQQTQTVRLDPATRRFVTQMRNMAGQGAQDILNAPGSMFADLTPEQRQAMSFFGQPVDLGLGGFSPLNVTAPGIDFSLDDSAIAQAILSGGGGPGRFDTERIQDFMDPYEAAVLEGQRTEFGRQREAALTRAAQEATAAGAFGGSRSGLLQATALRDINEAEERRLAELRSAGFSQALGAGLSEWQTQAQLATQAGIAQQAAMLQMLGMEQNQAFRMAENQMRAQLANQGAGLQAFGLQSQNALAQAGLQQSANQALFGMGEVGRNILQQQIQEPLWRRQMGLQLMNLGLGPYGQTTTGTSTQRVSGGGVNWPGLLLGAGQIALPFIFPGAGSAVAAGLSAGIPYAGSNWA